MRGRIGGGVVCLFVAVLAQGGLRPVAPVLQGRAVFLMRKGCGSNTENVFKLSISLFPASLLGTNAATVTLRIFGTSIGLLLWASFRSYWEISGSLLPCAPTGHPPIHTRNSLIVVMMLPVGTVPERDEHGRRQPRPGSCRVSSHFPQA